MSHTPGPWEVTSGGNYANEVSVKGKNGKHLVIARVCASKRGFFEARANARLMAAAPEMLEALEVIMTALTVSHHGASLYAIRDIARRAILKAKGQQP